MVVAYCLGGPRHGQVCMNFEGVHWTLESPPCEQKREIMGQAQHTRDRSSPIDSVRTEIGPSPAHTKGAVRPTDAGARTTRAGGNNSKRARLRALARRGCSGERMNYSPRGCIKCLPGKKNRTNRDLQLRTGIKNAGVSGRGSGS